MGLLPPGGAWRAPSPARPSPARDACTAHATRARLWLVAQPGFELFKGESSVLGAVEVAEDSLHQRRHCLRARLQPLRVQRVRHHGGQLAAVDAAAAVAVEDGEDDSQLCCLVAVKHRVHSRNKLVDAQLPAAVRVEGAEQVRGLAGGQRAT
jgi:hypothetical protein